MKYFLTATLFTVLLVDVSFAGDQTELKSQNDKVNYSIGYQMGGDFKRQGIEINTELLVQGIQDALAGGSLD